MDVAELVVMPLTEVPVAAFLNPLHFAKPHRRPQVLRSDMKRPRIGFADLLRIFAGIHLQPERHEAVYDVSPPHRLVYHPPRLLENGTERETMLFYQRVENRCVELFD